MPHRIQGTYLKNPFNCNLYLVNSYVLILLFFQIRYPHKIQAGAQNRFVKWMARCPAGWSWILEDQTSGNRGKSYLCCIWRHLVVVIWLLKYLMEGLSPVFDWDFQHSGSDFRNLPVPWFRKVVGKRNSLALLCMSSPYREEFTCHFPGFVSLFLPRTILVSAQSWEGGAR